MSDLNIGIVAEGPTDYEMLMALISLIIPGENNFLLLQPEVSETSGFGSDIKFGKNGTGWKGVCKWCESIATDFNGVNNFLAQSGSLIDLLIIQVDADITRENEINCYASCPPISDTVENLEETINGWLGEATISEKVIYCIPCDNTEAWILCSFDTETPCHNPPYQPLECLKKPDYLISRQGYKGPERLLKRKNGKPKKSVPHYREKLIPTLLENWQTVKAICSQAEAFEEDLLQFLV